MPTSAPAGIRAHAARAPSLGSDDRAQVLVLCGVLLVLGFVVVGSTIIQMQALDETTARVQRTEIAEPTAHAIAGFEDGIQRAVQAGETNMTDFLQRTSNQERLATANAVGRGLYMSVKRDENPTQDFLVTHCGGYHAGRSQQGVVVGYTKGDLTESIVGSVYFMHVTDGSRTMRWHHYVQIHECSDQNVNTYPEDYTVSLGAGVGDVKELRVADDGANPFSIKEQLDGTTWHKWWPDFDYLYAAAWAPANGPATDGGLAASHTGVLEKDNYTYQLNAPWNMSAASVGMVKVRIDVSHTPQALGENNDVLKLSVWNKTLGYNITYDIPVVQLEVSHEFEPLSPTGNGHWTYDEIRYTNWTLWVDEKGVLKDATRVYKVDYINTTIQFTEPKGHNLVADFTWVDIPDIYGDHVVDIRYQLDAHPANELFLLEVYNMRTGAWDLAATIADTNGGWEQPAPGFALVSPDHYERTGVNQPQFRIRNDPAFLEDNALGDLDTIHIDYFALKGVADNDP